MVSMMALLKERETKGWRRKYCFWALLCSVLPCPALLCCSKKVEIRNCKFVGDVMWIEFMIYQNIYWVCVPFTHSSSIVSEPYKECWRMVFSYVERIQAANQPSSYVHTFIFIFVYICSQFITRVSVSSHFPSLTDFWWSDIITTSHLMFVTTRKIDKIIMMMLMIVMLGYKDDRNCIYIRCTKMANGWFS